MPRALRAAIGGGVGPAAGTQYIITITVLHYKDAKVLRVLISLPPHHKHASITKQGHGYTRSYPQAFHAENDGTAQFTDGCWRLSPSDHILEDH